MKRAAGFAISLVLTMFFASRPRARCPGALRLDHRRRPRSERRRGAWRRGDGHEHRHGLDPKRHVERRWRSHVHHRASGHLRGARQHFRASRNSARPACACREDNVMRVNSLLEVGQVTDTVTVSAGVAVLQTDRADVRTEIPTAQLENLPVPVGRNYQNLFVTVPGISPPENMHSVAVNPARGLAFSSNGTTRNANAIRIEGADLEQPLAAARRRLRAGARSDRIGRRDDEHVRRRPGTVGRHVGERADQERHEPAARLGCSSTSTTKR